MHTDTVIHTTQRPRRWMSIEQLAGAFPAYTQPAIRSLIQRSRPHYNHRGEWVQGNGLASAICQPGGKNGRVLIDASAFADWLESWAGRSADTEANEVVA
jgi:hypothetical protein